MLLENLKIRNLVIIHRVLIDVVNLFFLFFINYLYVIKNN